MKWDLTCKYKKSSMSPFQQKLLNDLQLDAEEIIIKDYQEILSIFNHRTKTETNMTYRVRRKHLNILAPTMQK